MNWDSQREYERLYEEFRAAINKTAVTLAKFGMNSWQFVEADAKASEIWKELKALRKENGARWMG